MLRVNKDDILIFLVIFISFVYFFHLAPHVNSLTRYNLVRAIVDEGKINIDSYHKNTVDKSLYKGHYYSDKAIGTSLFALLPYWLIRVFHLPLKIHFIYYLLRVLCVSLPSALFAVLFYKFLFLFNPLIKHNGELTLTLFLGTLCFPYSTLFFGHQQAAIFCFVSFVLIYLLKSGYISSLLCSLLVGFLSGLAAITEYTSGIIITLLFIYLLITLRDKYKILFYFLSAAPSILLLLIYNYLCFEDPFALSYFHQAPEIAAKAMAKGYHGFIIPKLDIFYKILFSSYRGLFYFSPVLLLSIPGFCYLCKEKGLRLEFYICLISTVAFIILNASFIAWHGGYGIGPRYIIPALPFMAFPILFMLDKHKYFFRIFILLSTVSIIFMFLAVMIDPEVPQFIDNPIFDYILPRIFNNIIDYNIGYYIFSNLSLINILPLFIILFIILIIFFFLKKPLKDLNVK